MTWTFTLSNSTTLRVTSTARNGTTNVVFTTNLTVSAAPDAVEFYVTNMTAGNERQPYFNNLQISQGDGTPPVVTLSANQRLIAIPVGGTYTADAGATATDDVSGNVTSSITNNASTAVNLAAAGTYTVTYSATDEVGNVGTATQTVVVHPVGTFASLYNSMAAPGTYAFAAGWSADGTNNTAMIKVADFQWRLARPMTNRGSFVLKFVANADWAYEWGSSSTPGLAAFKGGDIALAVPTTGVYVIDFDERTLAYSIARATTNGLTYAQWATQYGLGADTGSADGDSDSLTNQGEYEANTDPLNPDTDGDGMQDGFEKGTSGYHVVAGSFNWDTARAHAMARGGNLATITSASEKNTIVTALGANALKELWLGGYQSGGAWKWVTGEPWAYTEWTGGTPSNDPTQDYLRWQSVSDGWDNWFFTPTYGSLPVQMLGYLMEKTRGTDPTKVNHPIITVALSFQGFTTSPTNSPSNLMVPVTGDEFGRELLVNFPIKVPSFSYKIAAGSWDTNWGGLTANQTATSNLQTGRAGGEDLNASVTALGIYRFYFNTETLQYSFARATFPDFAFFASAYGLAPESQTEDSDVDGLTNDQERLAGTHPTVVDTDEDGLNDGEEVTGNFSFFNPNFPNPISSSDRTNPLLADSDGDGLPDGWEVIYGLDPSDNGSKTSYANYTGLTTIPITGANPNGALANPDGDSGGSPVVAFSNLDEFGGGSSPVDALSIPAFRSVTFAVDMRAQILKGSFNRTNQGVELRASFNEWAGGQALVESATNGIYTNTFTVKGAQSSTIGYKFFLTDTNVLGNNVYEAGNDRTLTLGASEEALTAPVGLFGNEQARPVTFAVNLGVLSALGRFNTNTDTVSVVGPAVGGWGADQRKGLTNDGTGIYSGDAVVSGNEGSTNEYKFLIGTGWYEDLGNEVVGTGTNAVTNQITRKLVLGANLTNQVAAAPAPFFNNDAEVRTVTFAVNMNVQTNTNKLSFKLNGPDRVEVRYGPAFDGGLTLTNNGSGIFVGAYPISGIAGIAKPFKYVALSVTASNTNAVWERVDVPRTNEYANRSFVLGPSGESQAAHSEVSPALFSNDDGIGPVITVTGDNPLNLNFGGNYVEAGATAVDAIDGSLTATPSGSVNSSVAGSYTITYTASDAAGNTSTATRTVVVAAPVLVGSTFATWAGSDLILVTDEYLRKYAIGGASNLTAASERPVVAMDSNTLSLSAIVRTNDTNLTVVGEAGGSLTNWSTNGVTMLPSVNTNGVPEGHQRQVFSVDRANSPTRQFLRLKATLAP